MTFAAYCPLCGCKVQGATRVGLSEKVQAHARRHILKGTASIGRARKIELAARQVDLDFVSRPVDELAELPDGVKGRKEFGRRSRSAVGV
jgi:hypothetical protein